MTLGNITWGDLQNSATLLDYFEPEQASEYLSRTVFMDFEPGQEKPKGKRIEEFREKALKPALFSIASLYLAELRSEVDNKEKVVEDIWKSVMFNTVMVSDSIDHNDPDRDKVALLVMTDVVKKMFEPKAGLIEDTNPPSPKM